jgi:heme/copper-type cytochrome/quinol oxidase subunit 2
VGFDPGPGPRTQPDLHKLAEFEKRWLLIVVAILLALLLATIWLAPYGNSASGGAQIVRVDAQQFAWTLKPARVRAHAPVEFLLTSKDVNHGFGIYKGTKFVAQVQVVPAARPSTPRSGSGRAWTAPRGASRSCRTTTTRRRAPRSRSWR